MGESDSSIYQVPKGKTERLEVRRQREGRDFKQEMRDKKHRDPNMEGRRTPG